MKWNITSVKITDNNQHVEVEGYSLDDDITYFSSTIKRITFIEIININSNFHEGYAISMVNPLEIYIIELGFEKNNQNYNNILRNNISVSADKTRYFDHPAYMGLPPIVFMQWKGMLNTELNK